MNVLFMQTSDPYQYHEMVLETGKTIRNFCYKNDFQYECYVGIKRGYFPWHATYNRIIMLKELLDRGFDGWACYLDADAFIVNQNFDLREYLSSKREYGAVIKHTGVTEHFWDVNAGVIMINMRSSWGRWCINEWFQRFMQISDHDLKTALPFEPDDQSLLQAILRDNPGSRSEIMFESGAILNCTVGDPNWEQSFIAHFLRARDPDLSQRVKSIKRIVHELISDQSNHAEFPAIPKQENLTQKQEILIVNAIYLALLRRTADPSGLETYTRLLHEQGLEYGLPRVLESILGSEEFCSKRGQWRGPEHPSV